MKYLYEHLDLLNSEPHKIGFDSYQKKYVDTAGVEPAK